MHECCKSINWKSNSVGIFLSECCKFCFVCFLLSHKDDFSSILLVDHRYERQDIIKQIPKWIQKSLKKPNSFGDAFSSVVKFFRQFRD